VQAMRPLALIVPLHAFGEDSKEINLHDFSESLSQTAESPWSAFCRATEESFSTPQLVARFAKAEAGIEELIRDVQKLSSVALQKRGPGDSAV